MKMLTTGQVAKELQVSHDTAYRLVLDKIIPAIQVRDRGRHRVRLDDLQKYAHERGIKLQRELEAERQ